MIEKQARGIAHLYRFLGLYSIPVLTLVTTVSVANIFVHGTLIARLQWPGVEIVWAVVFAAAIEVNIVRLFFEARLYHDRIAFRSGVILVIVACFALLIEGMQQSIGFDWHSPLAQIGIGTVIVLRVCVVGLLLAREGSRLATVVSCHHDRVSPKRSEGSVPRPAVIHEEISVSQEPVSSVPDVTYTDAVEQKMHELLQDGTSIRVTAKKVGVSPSAVQRYKNKKIRHT